MDALYPSKSNRGEGVRHGIPKSGDQSAPATTSAAPSDLSREQRGPIVIHGLFTWGGGQRGREVDRTRVAYPLES
mgnify:CR=1 FL=1